MSLKKLLKNRSFEDYLKDESRHFKACCELSFISLLTPTFNKFVAELSRVENVIIRYIATTYKNKAIYVFAKEIALSKKEPYHSVSLYCKELYEHGILKRRKVKGRTGCMVYEYAVANHYLIEWLVLQDTKILTGVKEIDKSFEGGFKPGELAYLSSGVPKCISELVPGDTLVGSNGLCTVVK